LTSEPPKSEPAPTNRKRTDPLVGTVVDERFHIEEVIGSGGMSVVYKATQLRVNRHVAIKTLRMQLDEKPIYRERFHNEIQLLCALSHPNIVTVYDCVIGADDQPYVVMDYLRGRSLELLIAQEGAISVDRFFKIAVQVCGALDHAHRKGVIHRDLKPGNIVLVDDEMDFVKVVDFGLAKLNDGNRRLTQSGELWGSPPYMSPEQCQSKTVDERSDLYSFGAVMYEMLTGKDPFHYATAPFELIQIHVNTAPPPMVEANPLVRIPAGLEEVIFKTMAKNPDDRYQSASELRDAIIAVSGANGRHSGDLLAFATPGKNPSQSSGQVVMQEDATPRSATPSELFRRALDPMQGINVDELFEGTTNRVSNTTDTSNNSSTDTGKNTADAVNSARETGKNTADAVKSARETDNSFVPNVEVAKPLVTPLRIAAIGACCLIVLLVNALPNVFPRSVGQPAPLAMPANLGHSNHPQPNQSQSDQTQSIHILPANQNQSAQKLESSMRSAATPLSEQPATSQLSRRSTTIHQTTSHPSGARSTITSLSHSTNTQKNIQHEKTRKPTQHSISGQKADPWEALQGFRRK
jgi:serine/threonine protein kinase